MISGLSGDDKFSHLSLPKDNWPKWKQKMLEVLEMADLDEYVTGSITKPNILSDPSSFKNWRSNHRKIAAFIKSHIDDGEKQFITQTMTADEAWSALADRHEKQGPITQVRLIQELLSISYSEDVSTWPSATDRLRDLCARVFAQSIPTFDVLFMVSMLNALESKADNIRSEMTSYYISNSTSSSEALVNRINQEVVYKSKRAENDNVALSAQFQHKSKKICSNTSCKRTGHTIEDCFQDGGGMAGRKDEVLAKIAKKKAERTSKKGGSVNGIRRDNSGRAYIIDSESHEAILLAAAPSAKSATSTPSSENVALSAVSTDLPTDANSFEYHALVSFDDLITSVNWNENAKINFDFSAYPAIPINSSSRSKVTNSSPFILDSAASIHISPESSDFYDLKPISPRVIKGVGGSHVSAVGIGKIKLHVSKGNHIILEPALYVPQATVRLVSVKILATSQKLFSHFNDSACWLTNQSGANIATGSLASGNSSLGLYTLDISSSYAEHAFISTRIPNISTWHRRLGHLNHRSIVDMSEKGMVEGMPIDLSSDPPKCQHCILGKQTRSSVPKTREGVKALATLDVVYIDLTGPQSIASASGNLYVMNLIDDYSSFSWSIPIRSKDGAIRPLTNWVLAVERELGHSVGMFRLDNGELKSKEFRDWCASRGIRIQWTAPHTSAHNGRCERLHLALFNSARTMRLQTGLPANRWDEFILTANYLRVRVPTKALNNITPYEALYGHKPNLSHLREIGSRAFVLILNKHNPKIFQRSEEFVLIGYGSDSKTYRCYHRATHKVIESFHVVFIESKDELERPFKPGTHNGLLDDEDVISKSGPSVIPPTATSPASFSIPSPSQAPPNPAPPVSIPHPDPEPVALRRTSRTPAPSIRLAEAKNFNHISAVQKATAESRASALRAKNEKLARQQSRLSSMNTAVTEEEVANFLSEVPDSLAHCFSAVDLNIEFPNDPASFKEAMASADADKWLVAAKDEIASIKRCGVFKLVHRSKAEGRKVMRGKFVFRIKRDASGKPIRWKARFVAKGYEAVYGVDYTKTSSPTMRLETFRIIAHIAASLGWELHQIDVVTAFLRGDLPEGEEVFMEQPEGFVEEGTDWIWEVFKGLYGLPNGSRIWNKTMNEFMISIGFKRIKSEYCLYYRSSSTGTVLVGIHVDDFLAAISSPLEAAKFKAELRTAWEISDLGQANFCVGISIERDFANKHIFLSQTALIDKMLSVFNMTDANPVSTPMEAGLILSRQSSVTHTEQEEHELKALPYRKLVGLLMYLAIGTRPDIALAVQKLSQFLDCYTHDHWAAGKRVLRYLVGTRLLKLRLGGDISADPIGFADASFACCPDTRRSVGAYVFSLGSSGVVSWASRKQKTVALSTCDAEYIALSEACREAIWLRMLLTDIGHIQNRPTPILCDNTAARILSEDPGFHNRAKHIDTKYHSIRDWTTDKSIIVGYVPSKDNIADLLTKALPAPAFLYLRDFFGLCNYP